MNQLLSHLEFLLHERNCVIIPNMGGFVVNIIRSRKEGIALYHPPACELVFNCELTYNDGLLAESYMRAYEIDFESAMWKIEKAVSEFKQQLRDQQNVELGILGSFTLVENGRFRYNPGAFIRPSLFGLNRAELRPLLQMQKQPALNEPLSDSVSDVQTSRSGVFRHVTTVASIVAAVLLMLFVLPVGDTIKDRQSALLSYETDWFRFGQAKKNEIHSPVVETMAVADQLNEYNDNQVGSVPSDNPEAAEVVDNTLPADTPRFYIVMGVFRVNEGAQYFAKTLKREGFSETNLLERSGRYDVYATSFESREEAKDYLRRVHKEHPTYSDAWILKF